MIAVEFKKTRESLGFSQKELSEILGVSVRQIVNLENGKTQIREIYIEKISSLMNKKEQIKIPKKLNSHIGNKEIEILNAYRDLTEEDQEIFYHELKAAAAKSRKRAKENENIIHEDVKSVG